MFKLFLYAAKLLNLNKIIKKTPNYSTNNLYNALTDLATDNFASQAISSVTFVNDFLGPSGIVISSGY